MSEAKVYLVLSTAPVDEARALADQLLQEGLVACVNLLGPMTSRYHWQGEIQEGQEMLLLLKTRSDLRLQLRQRLAELHSYEVPEILEMAVDSGLPAYLAWVADSCRAEKES